MEGEFQVGEKCIATEEPEVMAIEMAKMTDAEICQVTQGGMIPPQGNTNPARKYNPNPCFRCGLLGHKAVDCPTKDKDKPPEIGGKIHHFLETNTPIDRDLWADLRTNRLHVGWSNEGRFRVQSGKEILIEAISIEAQPVVTMKKNITVPPRTLVVVEMQTVIPSLEGVGYYDFMPTERYANQEVNLVLIPVAYYTARSFSCGRTV